MSRGIRSQYYAYFINKTMDGLNDIILEALEVFVNHILYTRDFYPAQIFKKRRIYNTPVYSSIYPPLNTYFYKVLRTTRELLMTGQLEAVEVLLYKDAITSYERYKFTVKTLMEPNANNDEFLMEFEEQLRSSLYKLAERTKCLGKLPSDCKFKILVHTTQLGFVKLTHNPSYQDFPWLRCDVTPIDCKREISLLPITSLKSIGLLLNAEIL